MAIPYTVPTLSALRAQVRGFFAARLPGADTTLRRNNIGVSADAMAGVTFEQWGFLVWLADQLFPETAGTYFLERYARRYGITRKGATTASGLVTFTGTNGLPIPGGTLVTASDNVTTFATQATVTIASGIATATIVAIAGGSVGNLAASAPVNLVTAIAGIFPTAYVGTSPLTGGTDQESNAGLLARVQARERNPPQGGAASDWWQWALTVPNATRAWVFPRNRGNGTVDVAFAIDTRTNPIPLTADVTAATAAIAALPVPVTADWTVFAPVADPLAVTVASLVTLPGVTTAAAQASILASLADLVLRVGTPGGANVGDGIATPGGNPAGVIYLEQIDAAVSGAAGVASYDLAAPTADIVSAHGHMATLGTVTFS